MWETVLGQKLTFALCWLLEAVQFVVAINKPRGWTTQLPKLTNHFYRQAFQWVLVVAHVLSVFVIAFYTHAIWAGEASEYTHIYCIKYWYSILPTYSKDLDIADCFQNQSTLLVVCCLHTRNTGTENVCLQVEFGAGTVSPDVVRRCYTWTLENEIRSGG